MRRLRVGKEKGNKDALISYDSEAEHTTFLKEKKWKKKMKEKNENVN